MQFEANVAARRISLDSRVAFRGLTLVNSRKPRVAERNGRLASPALFSLRDATQFCDLAFGEVADLSAPPAPVLLRSV